ncbi:exonuclease domain-containing protein [Congregibacter litoralis]|uniref:DNA polymerase III, epsilon subunit n=1 Tax=Congregibacter litoralis KT71 TaxID=314285 RepID=A4A420_9GAMM|nr:exonuclease domain-containing protein [Congregibacter litoralis]EAQ99443.1 DNA polymerase III, epsilon subunit [Congregibacter litoralis KT71]
MWKLKLRRWRWSLRTELPTPVSTAWSMPLPAMTTPVEKLDFLVCDAEMSGLDPRQAELLSLGWVRVSGLEIALGSARHLLIRNRESVGQSATIHQLRDCELRDAGDVKEGLEALLAAAGGRVLVFHNAALDTAFLDYAAKAVFGAPLLLPTIDTLLLEKRLLQRQERPIGQGDLRLGACRERYGLTTHNAHNALGDAMATAELLLAHIAKRGRGLTLRDMV